MELHHSPLNALAKLIPLFIDDALTTRQASPLTKALAAVVFPEPLQPIPIKKRLSVLPIANPAQDSLRTGVSTHSGIEAILD